MKWLFVPVLVLLTRVPVFAGSTAVELPHPVSELSYQARFVLESVPDSARMELRWNGDGCRAEFAVHIPAHDDPFIEPVVRYRIVNSADSIVAQGRVKCAHAADGLTVALTASWPAARLAFGGRGEVFAAEVPFDFSHPADVSAEAGTGAVLLRHSMVVRDLADRPDMPFDDAAALTEYLHASTDPVEGLWNYLDRDMAVEQARLGQKYTLATVAGDRGGYYIIDVENFSVKGMLAPTPFSGHFNLVWYTADGIALSDEASASLQVDGNVLSLKFGSLGATVRFAKTR